MEPRPSFSLDQAPRSNDSLKDGRYATSVFNGTNDLPKSNENLSQPNYGISLTNPIHGRESVSEGGPEMVALKMAVDGTLIVLNVPS